MGVNTLGMDGPVNDVFGRQDFVIAPGEMAHREVVAAPTASSVEVDGAIGDIIAAEIEDYLSSVERGAEALKRDAEGEISDLVMSPDFTPGKTGGPENSFGAKAME